MSSAVPPAENRRVNPRRAAKSSVEIACYQGAWGAGPDLAVSLENVSPDGVRLVVREPLGVGQEVAVGLEGARRPRAVIFTGRVAWCREVVSGFCVGVRLDKRMALTDYFELGELEVPRARVALAPDPAAPAGA